MADVFSSNLGEAQSFLSESLILFFSHQPNQMSSAKLFATGLILTYVTLEVSRKAVLLTHSFILVGNSAPRLVFGL